MPANRRRVNKHLEEVQSGFLRAVGASLLYMLLGLLSIKASSALPSTIADKTKWTIGFLVVALCLWTIGKFVYRCFRLISFGEQQARSVDRKVRMLVERMEKAKGACSDVSAKAALQYTQEDLEAISADLKELYSLAQGKH